MQGDEFLSVPAKGFAPGIFSRQRKEEPVAANIPFVVEPENILRTRSGYPPLGHDGVIEETLGRNRRARDEKLCKRIAFDLACKVIGEKGKRQNLRTLLVHRILHELQIHIENNAKHPIAANGQAKQFRVF